MNFSQLNIAHWINKVYPPRATGITNPDAFERDVRIVQRALPPSLVLLPSVVDMQQFSVAAPGQQIDVPSVPAGRFQWVHAADFKAFGGVVGAAGFGFIQIVEDNSGLAVSVGCGIFETTDINAGVYTHANTVNATVGFGGGAAGGGGNGSFLIPPECHLRAVTTAVPAGGGGFTLTLLRSELILGEEFPSVG